MQRSKYPTQTHSPAVCIWMNKWMNWVEAAGSASVVPICGPDNLSPLKQTSSVCCVKAWLTRLLWPLSLPHNNKMYTTHCKKMLLTRLKTHEKMMFHKCKGSAELINLSLPNRHKVLSVSCCTVTRSPMSQHPLFISNTWLVPKKPPMTSQKKRDAAMWRPTAKVTRLLFQSRTATKSKHYFGLLPSPSSLSVESFQTCWLLCFSPSWCLLSLLQRKVS